jgi:hypothetical protein
LHKQESAISFLENKKILIQELMDMDFSKPFNTGKNGNNAHYWDSIRKIVKSGFIFELQQHKSIQGSEFY